MKQKHANLIIGIILFYVFVWDMETNSKPGAWFALLISILNLLFFTIDEITDRIKKHIDDSKQ